MPIRLGAAAGDGRPPPRRCCPLPATQKPHGVRPAYRQAGPIEKDPRHRLGMEGGSAPLGPVVLVDGAEVQLLQNVPQEVHRIVGVDGLHQRGG